jgi:hypothetical protein
MLISPNRLLSKAEWCRYCIQLRTLNLNHFKMVEAMGSKLQHLSSLQWHHQLTKFHENLPIDSEVICGYTQTEW